MPVSSASDSQPEMVLMKVGDRRKIMSKTLFTEISPGLMMGPSHHLRSSNTQVIAIEGGILDRDAWVRAISPGMANIEHTADGRITPVVVEP